MVNNISQFHLPINFNGLGHVNSLQNFKEHISSLISLGKLSTEYTEKRKVSSPFKHANIGKGEAALVKVGESRVKNKKDTPVFTTKRPRRLYIRS